MNILREFILCGWRQFVLFRQKSKSVSTWLTVSSVKHQPEGACLTEETERKEGRKETIQILLFPSSIFSIVLQREGKQLVGDKSIDVSGKFENKECALDTRNCFTFVVSHWTEDNRLSQYFIERDFSVVTSFYGSTNILKINLCILFGANFFFFLKRFFQKQHILTDVFILEIFFQLLFKARSWMKFISQWDTF